MLERGAGERLEHVEHGNMPAWAVSRPLTFWEEADARERKNGAVYREIEVALPRELTPDQRRALVQDFVRQEIGDKHAYSFAIHCPKASIAGGEQPHAHFMYSERTIDGIERDPGQYFKRANKKEPEKGGCVKDSAGTAERLQATRAAWAELQNAHLAKHGHQVQVDHRSLKEQGIERDAEQHLGPVDARKRQTVELLREYRGARQEAEQTQGAVAQLEVNERTENERIRAASIGRIGKNLGAADHACERADAACSDAYRASRGAAEAGRNQHARRAEEVAKALGRQLAGAIKEIARAAERVKDFVKAIPDKARAELADLANRFKANFAATQAVEQSAKAFKERQAAEQAQRQREAQAEQQKQEQAKQVEKAQELAKRQAPKRDGPGLGR